VALATAEDEIRATQRMTAYIAGLLDLLALAPPAPAAFWAAVALLPARGERFAAVFSAAFALVVRTLRAGTALTPPPHFPGLLPLVAGAPFDIAAFRELLTLASCAPPLALAGASPLIFSALDAILRLTPADLAPLDDREIDLSLHVAATVVAAGPSARMDRVLESCTAVIHRAGGRALAHLVDAIIAAESESRAAAELLTAIACRDTDAGADAGEKIFPDIPGDCGGAEAPVCHGSAFERVETFPAVAIADMPYAATVIVDHVNRGARMVRAQPFNDWCTMLWQSQSVVPPEKDRRPPAIAVPPMNEEFVRRALHDFSNQSGLAHSVVKRMSMSLFPMCAPIVAPEAQPEDRFDAEVERLETVDSKLFVPDCDIAQVMREFLNIQIAE
jgi:hypothetical protein